MKNIEKKIIIFQNKIISNLTIFFTCVLILNMPITDFETIMLPLIKFTSDSKEHSSKEAVD